jgi:hypothetical protein
LAKGARKMRRGARGGNEHVLALGDGDGVEDHLTVV